MADRSVSPGPENRTVHAPDHETTPGARRILDAASPLFAARGYSGVSMQQVANAAGVSKANVFHHFASKPTLYAAVLERSAEEFRSLFGLLGGDSRDGLASFARGHMSHLLANAETVGMFLRLLGEATPSPRREHAEALAVEALDGLIATLEARRRDGALPAEIDCGALAVALLGANLLHMQLRHVLPRTRLDPALRDPATFAGHTARQLALPVTPSRSG